MQNKKGRGPKEAKEFDEEVIQLDRVTRVVKGGRRMRFRATVAIGNHKGKVGIGIGKSAEVQGAIQKAISQAKKSTITVPMVGQTIPHRIQVKFKSAKLLLMPACPGTGIIAGGPLRKIVELAGIQDILSKSLGCNNRVTNTQAAMLALGNLHEIPWLKKAAPPTVTKTEIPSDTTKPENKSSDPEKQLEKQPTKATDTARTKKEAPPGKA